MPFAEPEMTGGPYPRDLVDHLLLVWATDYIDDAPSKFSGRGGTQADVIVVDVVDLDDTDPVTHQPGALARGCWWRPGKLIQALKRQLGSADPVLARMQLGTANPGFNAPYVLVSATSDTNAVARADAWLKANPDFMPTGLQNPMSSLATGTAKEDNPEPTRVATDLERLARMAREGADRLPPQPPGKYPY